MDFDPDIIAEADVLESVQDGRPVGDVPRTASGCPFARVGLNIRDGAHQRNEETASLLAEIGGPSSILRCTQLFYAKVIKDSHIAQFLRDPSDPHADRLANWIVEKMGKFL